MKDAFVDEDEFMDFVDLIENNDFQINNDSQINKSLNQQIPKERSCNNINEFKPSTDKISEGTKIAEDSPK